MNLKYFTLFLMLLNIFVVQGAQHPIVPIRIRVQKLLRVPLSMVSNSTIMALQKDHQLPPKISRCGHAIFMSNGKLWGGIRVQIDADKLPWCKTNYLLLPNYVIKRESDGICIAMCDEHNVQMIDGVFPAHYIADIKTDIVAPVRLDRKVGIQVIARSLKQSANYYTFPKEFENLRTASTNETLKKISSIKIGSDTCSVNVSIFSLAIFAVQLIKWAKNLYCPCEKIVLPAVPDEWCQARTCEIYRQEQEFLSICAAIEGQRVLIDNWHAENHSAGTTSLAIDFFEKQSQFLLNFLSDCDRPDFWPACYRTKAAEYGFLVDAFIRRLKESLNKRNKFLRTIHHDIKHTPLCLQEIQEKLASIDVGIELLHKSLLGPHGWIARRDRYLATIDSVPGLLARYEHFEKNSSGWMNRCWDMLAIRTERSMRAELKSAVEALNNAEENILNIEADLEERYLRKACYQELLNDYKKNHEELHGSFLLKVQPWLLPDGYVVEDATPERIVADVKEAEIQECEYRVQRAHIEESWLRLMASQEGGHKLSKIEQRRFDALEKTVRTNGFRSAVVFDTTPEMREALTAFDVALDKFIHANLNEYQIQLAREQVGIIGDAYQLKIDVDHKADWKPIAGIVKGMCDDATQLSLIANECNRQCRVKQAELFTDCARTCLDCALAPVKGVVLAIEEKVTQICPFLAKLALDPWTTAKETSVWAEESAKAVGAKLFELFKISARQEQIRLMVLTGHKDEATPLIEQEIEASRLMFAACNDALAQIGRYYKEHTVPEITTTIFKHGASFAIDGLIFHRLGAFFENVATKATMVVEDLWRSKSAIEIELLLAQTPEGFNLKLCSEFSKKYKPAAAAEDFARKAAAKDSSQVIAKYERYIQTMRLRIPKLEKYLEQQLSHIKDPLFTKAKLKHLFGVEKLVKERLSGKFDAKYSGYHHDKGWKLVQTGKIKFLSDPQVCTKTGAVMVAELTIEGEVIKNKTFFPPEWSRHYVIDKIVEASKNTIKDSAKEGVTCLEIKGVTKEGLEILLVIRKEDKFLITAYPVIN